MKHINIKDFDAVAFDVEGTLADTIPTHHAARLEAFAHHGYGHISREQHELGPTYGSSTADIIGGVLHAAGAIEKDTPFKEHPAVRDVIATKMRIFQEIADHGFQEMPGASHFVRAMSIIFAGRLALVTSSAERFVTPFLERYQIKDLFSSDLIITEDTVISEGIEGKPAPDPYTLAMQRLNTQKLLVFEDTAPGVMSAKQAGATVIALGFDKHSAKLFTSGKLAFPPDAFVHNYQEAYQLLGITPASNNT